MRIERMLNAVREALLWMGSASGDPSALMLRIADFSRALQLR
jgi:hypothetical protein